MWKLEDIDGNIHGFFLLPWSLSHLLMQEINLGDETWA
jgi:hypothetical protein